VNTTKLKLHLHIFDNRETLDDFHPISLCKCVYKVISKVIARRVKRIISERILGEKFGLLEGRKIHEAIGVAQEGLHNMKSRNLKGVVLKIDLSKAYDRVSWLFIHLLLTHLGFAVPFINWVMNCLTIVSFVVLINGLVSPFFPSERDLRQGCPLSPLLFLLVIEGFSRDISEAKRLGYFSGIEITQALQLTHLLFVDDVLIFSVGSKREDKTLNNILLLFSKEIGMKINKGK
jgi:hypothetical protein